MYNITYFGPEDNLRGVIMTLDDENLGQFLFNDMGHLSNDNPTDVSLDYRCPEYFQKADQQLDASSMPLIKSGDLIKLSGPAQASIDSSYGFDLEWYLFGVLREQNITFHKDEYKEPLYVPLKKVVYGDGRRRRLMIRYAVFDYAIEARVKVNLTKVNSVFDFAGTISARTSAITDPDYTSILFSKGCEKKLRLEPEEEMFLQLSRQFVVVPLGSQLILQFALHVDDYKESKTVTFVAKKGVKTTTQEIVYSKGVIQVKVSWRSKRHPKNYVGRNNGYWK